MISLVVLSVLGFGGVLGAIMGSFVTALTYRQRHGWSMMAKHSQCPNCRHELGWRDLLPIVSYVLQRGRCRYCGARIGKSYIVTEIVSAVLYVAGEAFVWTQASHYPGISQSWVITCLVLVWGLTSLLLALAHYDSRWGELPNIWTLGGSAVMVVAVVAAELAGLPMLWRPWIEGFSISAVDALISGVVAVAFFWVIAAGSEWLLKKPGMGMGDAKLALLLGIWLGFPAIIVGLYVAFIFGAVLSLLLIAGKQKSFGASLPFGPFLIGGSLAAMWISPAIISWYSQFWL